MEGAKNVHIAHSYLYKEESILPNVLSAVVPYNTILTSLPEKKISANALSFYHVLRGNFKVSKVRKCDVIPFPDAMAVTAHFFLLNTP